MPASRIEDQHDALALKSRLGVSLMRLHGLRQENSHHEEQTQSLFLEWQKQWSSRRDQIASRLQMIETRLQELTQDVPTGPRLNIVGLSLEDEAYSA